MPLCSSLTRTGWQQRGTSVPHCDLTQCAQRRAFVRDFLPPRPGLWLPAQDCARPRGVWGPSCVPGMEPAAIACVYIGLYLCVNTGQRGPKELLSNWKTQQMLHPAAHRPAGCWVRSHSPSKPKAHATSRGRGRATGNTHTEGGTDHWAARCFLHRSLRSARPGNHHPTEL